MQFHVVEPEGLDLSEFQVLEVASRWTRGPTILPGALRLDPCFVEAEFQVSRYFPRYREARDARLNPELVSSLTGLGLIPGRPLLVAAVGPWGPVNGGRVAWALCASNFAPVYWLNGGAQAWSPGRRRASGPGSPIPRSCLAQAGNLQGAVLLDVRSRREFSGQRQDRYRFFRSRGHLPGALWLGDWTRLVTPQRRLGQREHLQRHWRAAGLTPDQDLVFYCGTGWRSSLACCVALWLGYARVRNYDGGVYDWLSHGLPLAVEGEESLSSQWNHAR